jgi:pyruvate/2-oxoglutarate dehydrogenase complex dihydrolipoamide acyltransferase (E2) component
MKQTAVEWLAIKLWEEMNMQGNGAIFNEIVEQAKAMEKEQIINAWIATDNELQRIAAKQYYNETFN